MINNLISEFGYGAVRNGIKNIADTIVKSNSSTIYVYEPSIVYDNMNKLLYKLDKNQYNKNRMPVATKSILSLNVGTLYFIRMKTCIIKVECDKQDIDNKFYQSLTLSFYGKDKYKIRKKIITESLNTKVPNKISILANIGSANRSERLLIPENNFNDLILEEDVKNRIINGLINWDKSNDWYIKHHLVHKIGVLLYGTPGTGKTSISKAISNMFNNAPIYTLNFNSIYSSVSDISFQRSRIDGVIIILIEDFDMFFFNREDDNESKYTKTDIQEKQNVIFQLLDGVFSLEDTIFIATTNHKEKLDPALIRHGRFDIQAEINPFDREFALEAVRKFDYDEVVLDSFDLEYPVQPAFLQSKIMEHRSNTINNPDFKISMREHVSKFKELAECKSNIPIITAYQNKNVTIPPEYINIEGTSIYYNKDQYTLDGMKRLRYIGKSNKPDQPIGLKDYQYMFAGSCKDLDLSHWDMSEAEYLHGMFYNANIKNISSLKDWDVSKVKSTYRMFYHTLIENLDSLVDWDLSSVVITGVDEMFGGCKYLKDIDGFKKCYEYLKINKSIFKDCDLSDTNLSMEDSTIVNLLKP